MITLYNIQIQTLEVNCNCSYTVLFLEHSDRKADKRTFCIFSFFSKLKDG
jgi:hypothetical protein